VRRSWLTALAVFTLVVPRTGAAAGGNGPALSVPESRLAAALACPATFNAGRDPVLLVHGTATNSRDSWSWNYQRVLPAMGYGVCTVDLPDRALGDIQVSAEYVVHASGAEQFCSAGSCAPAVHQMRRGARFLDALNAGDETPGELDYTSIYSESDELVQPPLAPYAA
jgi:triacylglycerol lipase